MFDKLLEQIEATELADKILETYKRVETDESYSTGSDSISTPVATLADEYGGRAQIGVDDGCYVLYLLQEDGSYKHTAWIFPEAHEVLKDLPDPDADIIEKCDPEPEDGIKDFEYLLHHIVIDDKGKEEIHHCLVYDHIGNMFGQGHLVVKNGKITLDGKKVEDGIYHVLKCLEPEQEVAWSDDEAKKNNIDVKQMKSGMSLKDKSKVW